MHAVSPTNTQRAFFVFCASHVFFIPIFPECHPNLWGWGAVVTSSFWRVILLFRESCYSFLYIPDVIARVIPFPCQLPTKGGNTILVALAVMTPLVPTAAFTTGQGIVFVYMSLICPTHIIDLVKLWKILFSTQAMYKLDKYY